MSIRPVLFALVTLSLALPAAAQSPRPRQREVAAGSRGSMTSELQRNRRRVMSPYLMNGFGIGGGLINVSRKSDINITEEISQFGMTVARLPNKFDDSSANNTSFGLAVNYSVIQRLGFGFIADLAYTEVPKIAGEHSAGVLRPAANVAFGGARNFYGFGGIHMPIFDADLTFKDGTPLAGEKIRLRGQPGWQAGAGYVSGSFQVSGQYSSSKIKIDESFSRTLTPGQQNTAVFDGSIDLSGFELVGMYRF